MKPSLTARKLQATAWGLSLVVILLAFIAWGQSFAWQFNRLSTYRLFPLFGLLAFSLMWSHYIVSVIRTHHKTPKENTKAYFEITSLMVLVCILLHPALLVWQLWRDGYGLPPESYKAYVAPGLVWVVLLGTISWFAFLAYEFHREYGSRDWWRYIQYASDAAMVAILYHSLRLGSTLQRGWFHYVWLFYGLSLFGSLLYLYLPKKIPS
jgi:glucan phosphoethanolaminetransferase (alkaline phosphatase superfamily)